MDLSSLLQPLETEVEIIHPATSKPVGIRVTLLSRHHPDIKAMARKIGDSRMALARRNKPMDSAAIETELVEILVASVKSWSGVDRDGVPLACTPENVRDLLSNPGYQWIRKQLDDAMGNDALFFGA